MAAPDSSRRILVWDPPVRLFHWALVVLFTACWISGRMGKLQLHVILGEAVLALLLFRLAWGVVGSSTARFASFVAGPAAMRAYLRGQRRGLGHNPLGALSVLALLALVLVQALSGLATSDDIATDGPLVWAFSSAVVKAASGVHRTLCWGLLALVGLHLAAIAFYRLAKGEDLVLPMITGSKPEQDGGAQTGIVPASPLLALALAAVAAAVVFGGVAVWGK